MAFDYYTKPFSVKSILKLGIPREQIFLTDKAGFSLNEIGIGYYDLFLLHHPPLETGEEFEKNVLREWRQKNVLLQTGLVKTIGVSNFNQRQLEVLLLFCEKFGLVKPSVNQIELHPFNQNWYLVDFYKNNDIQVVAHTPLAPISLPIMYYNRKLLRK